MEDSKLLKVVNVSTAVGKRMMRLGMMISVSALVPLLVAVVADRIHAVREWADYADVDGDPHDYSFLSAGKPDMDNFPEEDG